MENITKHVSISGKVQGVWFRASTKKMANKLGLNGWVRNTSDGRVEAVFQGDKDKVDEIIKWCHQGSSMADVDSVEAKKQETEESFKTFKIKH